MMNVFALISIKKKTKLKYYLSWLLKGFFFFFGISLNFVPEASALLASPWFCPRPAMFAGKLKIFHQLQRASWCATRPAKSQAHLHSCLDQLWKLTLPCVPFRAGGMLDCVVTGWNRPPGREELHWTLVPLLHEGDCKSPLGPKSLPNVTGMQGLLVGF